MLPTILAGVGLVVPAENDLRVFVSPPGPKNALVEFASNEFNAWSISRRYDLQLGRKEIEVAPMPRRIDH